MTNSDFKDKIEDTLIHFEDAGYSFNIHYDFFCNDRFGSKVYDVLKKVNTNEDIKFGDRFYIQLNSGKSVMSWKEYQWHQSELKTAITRMTDDFDNVNILKTTDGETGIEINGKTFEFRNIKDLTDKCKYFNSLNNSISVYPEYHVEEGIALYVREMPTATDKILNRGERFFLYKSIKIEIEKLFGKDYELKKYEEGEAEKENPYLKDFQLSKYIVAKINCDFIKI